MTCALSIDALARILAITVCAGVVLVFAVMAWRRA